MFNFLKKSKKENLPEPPMLDVPPPPMPGKEVASKKMLSLPIPEKTKIPPIAPKEPQIPEFPDPEMPKSEPDFPFTIQPKPEIIHPARHAPFHPKMEEPPTPRGHENKMEKPPLPHRKSTEFFDDEIDTPPKARGPIFVTMDRYEGIMERINSVKVKLNESQDTLLRLTEIENRKEEYYEKWHNTLEELQKKVVLMDKKMFEELIK